jgi:hypothetical protein
MLHIIPIGISWLEPELAAVDLCAHGRVQVIFKDQVLFDTGPEGKAVSTAALHLLRTLEADHTEAAPLFEHLIPCCGHFMYFDESGQLVTLGCPNGGNWWVVHDGASVLLEFPDGPALRVSEEDWCQAVVIFADQVWAFYQANPERQIEDEYDAVWFAAFMAEWQRRRAAATYDPPR